VRKEGSWPRNLSAGGGASKARKIPNGGPPCQDVLDYLREGGKANSPRGAGPLLAANHRELKKGGPSNEKGFIKKT